jgi:hypothetical protein
MCFNGKKTGHPGDQRLCHPRQRFRYGGKYVVEMVGYGGELRDLLRDAPLFDDGSAWGLTFIDYGMII